MNERRLSANSIAIITLFLLWALFFWRILTPIDADKAAFKQGDFSAQFVAFGAYQYDRITNGEIPLWNPYNNSGLPFIGDTQAAVFYPPRLMTITLAWFTGGWSYHALELEVIFHVLFYTLTMYWLVRRMTGNVWGGLVAAIIGGYGGYLSGYPPLQLALLEAGVWLPLAILGIYEGTQRQKVSYAWLAFTGAILGLSWLAGHPQTSWFLTYLVCAFYAYRLWQTQTSHRWRTLAIGIIFFGGITFGATAVTFIPGAEYLMHTARTGIGYAAKNNGFPIQDIIQFLYPGTVSAFSPLYIGVVGLMLVIAARYWTDGGRIFWFGVALVGLLLSMGGNSPVFPALYNLLPGLRSFRGQERAAYLVVNSLAILAGFGMTLIMAQGQQIERTYFKRSVQTLPLITGIIFIATTLLWFGNREAYGGIMGAISLTFIVSAVLFMISARLIAETQQTRLWSTVLVALLVFELFTVNMDAPTNYDNQPPANQLSFTPPPLIQPVLPESPTIVQRVDGFRGLGGNYGSLYGVYDARGISPLFLDGLYALQQPPFAVPENFESNPVFWELNAVKFVYSGYEELPVKTEIITQGSDQFGAVFLHQLENPRPFAHLVYRYDVVDSDEFARALLTDPNFQAQESVILHQEPTISVSNEPSENSQVQINTFDPERIIIAVNTSKNAILSLAHPDYPGWRAMVDDEPASLIRAYGGFTALSIPTGEHIVTLTYRPLSVQIGAIMSLVTWAGLIILGGVMLIRGKKHANNSA